MTPHLLVPVLLLLGVTETQTANVTQWSTADGNRTLSVSQMFNITLNPENVTLSLYKNEKSQVEDELQENRTSVFAEEDENFQAMENKLSAQDCDHHKLLNYSQEICVFTFDSMMREISKDDWCVMENIIGPYNEITQCLEIVSAVSTCFYPNPEVQDVFISVHSSYFHNCTEDELQLEDAPQGVVLVLTLVPVGVIPALVYLVVWKSKVQD